MDVNNDGRLSKSEMLIMYTKKMGEAQATNEIESIMTQVDSDGSGFIDYTEFLAASMDQYKLLSKSNLKTAFQMFDSDGSGKISANELHEMLGSEGSNSGEWAEIIAEVDKNGDGEIDIKEFEEVLVNKC
jgi:calcium-dependent protein kinase